MNAEQKLDTFAEKEFRKIMPNLIIETEPGHHLIFGTYLLNKISQGVELRRYNGDFIATFGSQRSAISYCVADKFQKYNLARKIQNLDTKHTILANDIACRRALAESSRRAEFRELVQTKIGPTLAQHRAVSSELEKCINLAKYLQVKGFQNETARVFSSQAH